VPASLATQFSDAAGWKKEARQLHEEVIEFHLLPVLPDERN